LYVIRSSDTIVGGLKFYRDSSSSVFFFIRQPPFELAKRNSTKTGHMLGGDCDLKMHVWNLGYPLPLKIEGPKPRFSTTSQVNGKFSGLSSERNMIYIIWQVRLKSQGVSYIVSKCCELWCTNGIKVDRSFYTLSVNAAFCFIARLRRRRSANGTQPNFAKRWTLNRANNLS